MPDKILDTDLTTATGGYPTGSHGTAQPKPRLSFLQIWNMSFGFLGIQFGFALQNANVSRIFQTLGAEVEEIPILWLAAPVTGLIIQPIIGYYSDRTWTGLGRRRPYFLVGAVLASIALVFMPNSPTLWIAAGTLWIMDASINVTMEPFRAFVGDNLPDDQATSGFAMQSFFIGIGAVVASMLPYILTNWFGMSNEAPEGIVPDSVKWAFYLGGGVFFLAVLYTVFTSREYSPEQMKAFETPEPEYERTVTADDHRRIGHQQFTVGSILLLLGVGMGVVLYFQELEKELYVLAGLLALGGALALASGQLQRGGEARSVLSTLVNDFQFMPSTMKQLAWVQFFSWFALFSMWIYTTAAVTQHVYGTTDTTSSIYQNGADWVGVCFAVYNGVAALIAFLLPQLASRIGRKATHAVCLVLGGLGLVSIMFITDPNLLLVSMVGIGIAWASILSMPYAILTKSLPADKMGYYMGVFNFFIVIPQIVAATILGFLLATFFGGDPIYAMVIGGVSFVISALLTLRVDD